MKMYYNNRFTTALLVIATMGLYILKYSNVVFEIKLFTYLMIFALSLILTIITLLSIASLIRVYKYKSYEKESNNTIECIKILTNTKIHLVYFVSVIVLTVALSCIFIYADHNGEDVFIYIDCALDILTGFGIIAVLIQRYINYAIYTSIK